MTFSSAVHEVRLDWQHAISLWTRNNERLDERLNMIDCKRWIDFSVKVNILIDCVSVARLTERKEHVNKANATRRDFILDIDKLRRWIRK